MHTFNILHEIYHGSPPPGLCPQIFGSCLLYYNSSALPVPRAYNSPQNWVRSMQGKLDHTRLHDLWSNPQIHPSLGLLCSTTYKLVCTASEHYKKSLTTTNELPI
jgi:hypothetical protein